MHIARRHTIDVSFIISSLFTLFVFVLIVDPPNTLFRLKDVVFAAIFALMCLSYRDIDRRIFVFLIALYSLITLSLFRGMAAGYSFDLPFMGYVYKTFVPLFLLLWMRKLLFFTWRSMVLPGVLVALFTIFVTVVMMLSPELETIIYNFVKSKEIMMMGRRSFLGIPITGAYYRSLPVIMIPAAIVFYKALNERKHRFWTTLCSLLFLIAMTIAGTRASMLAAFIIVGVLVFMKMRRSQAGRMLMIAAAVMLVPLFVYFVYRLMSETGESSNFTKYGHLESYIDLLRLDPWAFIFGTGPGSRFFSKGFNMYTEQTEWSYAEFIRMFGIGTTLLLVFFYSFPIYKIYRRRSELEYSFAFSLAYFIYLLVAGTNPLLIGSNGTLALICSYNYAYSGNTKGGET